LASLPELTDIPDDSRGRAAIHEAGHAAVITEFVSIGSLPRQSHQKPESGKSSIAGNVRTHPIISQDCTLEAHLADIAVLLGGIVAKEIFFGCRSDGVGCDPGTDLHMANIEATLMNASVGLGQGLNYLPSRDEADLLASLQLNWNLRMRVEAIPAQQLDVARRIIGLPRPRLISKTKDRIEEAS
jgi:hypothetical protein